MVLKKTVTVGLLNNGHIAEGMYVRLDHKTEKEVRSFDDDATDDILYMTRRTKTETIKPFYLHL